MYALVPVYLYEFIDVFQYLLSKEMESYLIFQKGLSRGNVYSRGGYVPVVEKSASFEFAESNSLPHWACCKIDIVQRPWGKKKLVIYAAEIFCILRLDERLTVENEIQQKVYPNQKNSFVVSRT